jgi:hypothetical protein
MSFCGLVKFAVNTAGNNLHLLYAEACHAFRVRFREKGIQGNVLEPGRHQVGTKQAPTIGQKGTKPGPSRDYIRTVEELSNEQVDKKTQ